MNHRRVFLAAAVAFLAYMAMGIVVHGFWLGPTYESLIGDVWRPQAELTAKAWIVQGTTVIFCWIFAYLFARFYRGGGWQEGLWFGTLAYFFVGFQAVFHAYATYPLPLDLVLKWFLAGLPMFMILGVLVSIVYRGGDQGARPRG